MSEEGKQEAVPPAAVETPAASAGEAAPAARTGARVSRRVPSVDKVAARHPKALADAATTAKAVKLAQPAKLTKVASTPASDSAVKAKPAKAEKVAKNGKAAKAEKPAKPRKLKLVRDSFAMPEAEYAKIAELKKRLAALGSEVKKSELLRGGVGVLAALNDAELKAVMARVERIKTGRPTKK